MSAVDTRATTTADVVAAVSDAAARDTALRIVGARTWLDAGRPVRADSDTLDVRALSDVIHYTPGDLTCTVGAGMTIAELDALTAPHGQWCPLMPWGGDAGTVGATLATATAGPCAATLGLPRDLALGLELVDGRGSVVRAGGSVVKNVAGFDLVRLNVGAWGSLGVLTAASLRLRARPAVDRTFALPVSDAAAIARVESLRTGALVPLSLELVNATAAAALGLGAFACALVRVGGNAAFVRAAVQALHAGGEMAEAPTDVWTRLRSIEPAQASTWRESVSPSRWPSLARAIQHAGDDDGRVVVAHCSVQRGVLRVSAQLRDGDDPYVAGGRWRTTPTAIRERPAADPMLSAEATHSFRVPTTEALSQRVREAFDPASVLNPGILG